MGTVYPDPVNITGPVELFQYVNSSITNDMFGISILAAIFLIAFISAGADNRAFTASSFGTTLAAIYLSLIGIVAPEVIFIMTAITGLSIFLLFRD